MTHLSFLNSPTHALRLIRQSRKPQFQSYQGRPTSITDTIQMPKASLKNVLLIDMDNTVVDWDTEFISRWLKHRPEDHDIISNRKHFELEQNIPSDLQPLAAQIMSEPGFYKSLQPLPGAVAAIKSLHASGLHILLCTAPMPLQYETCVAEKYAWVREWLGEDFLSRIVVTRDKTVVGGRVLIDDKPKISGCLSEEERDWVHVIFEQSYNVGVGGVRMRGWAEYKHVLGEFFDALRM